MKANVVVASLSNLDEAAVLFKQLGRVKEAQDVIDFFVKNKPPEFWDVSVDPFRRVPLDPDVAMAFNIQKAAAASVPFDPEAELVKAEKTYDSDSIKKLAEVPIDEYYKMIKSKRGEEMRILIFSALQ